MPKPKGATSLRLSQEALQLLESLAEKFQIKKFCSSCRKHRRVKYTPWWMIGE